MHCDRCRKEARQPRRGMCAACYWRWRREHLLPNARCEQCGRAYFNPKPMKHAFCSRSCFNGWKVGRDSRNALMNGQKQVPRTCLSCGRTFGVEQVRVAQGRGRYCSRECSGLARRKHPSRFVSPENVWRAWRGYPKLRDSILHAPGACCARCGAVRTYNNLVVHHHVPPDGDARLLFNPANLEILCRACHLREHRERGDLEVAA